MGPLSWIPPNDEFPEGGIVSGGMDTLVIVWNLATGEKVQMLKGHKLQVTGTAVDGLDIVSVSVDWYVGFVVISIRLLYILYSRGDI